jgi:hypothetical protein
LDLTRSSSVKTPHANSNDADRVQGAPNDESRRNYLRVGTRHSVARMAGSWSRERPANGQDNAGIDDCRVRGPGWVVVGSTRVRTDRALGPFCRQRDVSEGVGWDAAWLRMDDPRLSDCAATFQLERVSRPACRPPDLHLQQTSAVNSDTSSPFCCRRWMAARLPLVIVDPRCDGSTDESGYLR